MSELQILDISKYITIIKKKKEFAIIRDIKYNYTMKELAYYYITILHSDI